MKFSNIISMLRNELDEWDGPTRLGAFSLLLSALALALCFSTPAHAQDSKFSIAGGGGSKNGSVYSAMIGDLAERCSTDALTITETTTSGGVENLALLRANKVKAALVPLVLLVNAKAENAASVAQIKTLVPMHIEAVHLIVRADTKTEGGITIMGKNLGGDTVTFNNPEDLKGRAVGAVGGTMVDGQFISDKLRYGWVMQSYKTTALLLDALAKKQIDAILITAGLPSPAVDAIGGNFKLLPLRGNSDTAEVYAPVKVQYAKLNSNRPVDTLSEQAQLVTRRWSSDEMNASLAQFRACFKKQLPKLKDADGTQPTWQDDNTGVDLGKWPLYELPKVSAVEAPATAQSALAIDGGTAVNATGKSKVSVKK